METCIPGGFPCSATSPAVNLTTPTKVQQRKITTPFSTSFKFTPTKNNLYPMLESSPTSSQRRKASPFNEVANASYCEKENQSFVCEMEHLQEKLFSSRLTSNVLSEFRNRYKQVREEGIANIKRLNRADNDTLNRRSSSSRFSGPQRTKLMDSARKRGRITPRREPERAVVSTPIEYATTRCTSGDKHRPMEHLGSSSKRLRKIDGNYQEIVSPTREQEEKARIKEVHLQRLAATKVDVTQEPVPELHFRPVKSSERPLVKQRPIAKPTPLRSRTNAAPQTKPTPPLQKRHRMPSYLLPTKASLQRMAKPTTQISPSRAYSNLNSFLSKSVQYPEPPVLDFKSHNVQHSSHSSHGSHASHTSQSSGSRTSSNSSVPRLATASRARTYSRASSRSTSTTDSRSVSGKQPWKY